MSAGLLLVGASGLAREILATGVDGVAGILDDDTAVRGTEVGGVPVIGDIAAAATRDERLLICVGSGAARRSIARRLAALGVTAARYHRFLAPTVRVGAGSDVGPGSILLDGVVITADVVLGAHTVVMPNCTITHDDVLADYATLAAGVALGGGVHVGEAAYIGMNASVRQGVTVGAGATVGMGAVVLRDVPEADTWAGVPARSLNDHRRAEPSERVLGEHA